MTELFTAIGMMSGTSMDGIDLALIETDGFNHVRLGPTAMLPYDAVFRQALADALGEAATMARRTDRPGPLAAVEREITARHREALAAFLADNAVAAGDVDLLGFHGQTVLHRPDKGLTVQLGDGKALATATGITTVWDMRANDMENGGQGAPLVPIYHRMLAARLGGNEPVAFVNIGGIANVTFVQPGQAPIAFDCGPGNALIDQWMAARTNQAFDDGGALALTGTPDEATVDRLLLHPFFEQAYPKSLDRNDFHLDLPDTASTADGAATLAAFSAAAIARAQRTSGVRASRWIISGGGARNRAILDQLRSRLPDADVTTADAVGLDGDAMEAQCWAYLAVRAKRGLVLTFPETTGCTEACSGGIISHP